MEQNLYTNPDYNQRAYHVKDYGVIGDGVTDNTKAIQTIIDKAVDGDTLVFQDGEFALKGIQMTHSMNILSRNATLISLMDKEDDTLITYQRRYRTHGTLSADVKKEQNEITLSSLGTIEIGDIVYITSSRNVFPGSGTFKEGSLCSIIELDRSTNKIFTDRQIDYDFPISAKPTIYVFYPHRNITVNGLHIQLKKDAFQRALYIRGSVCIKISNCRIYGGGENKIAVYLKESLNGTVTGCIIDGFEDYKHGGSYGYGVELGGHNLQVQGCIISHCKHAITSGDNNYYVSNIRYEQNIINYCKAALDCHENTEHVSMRDNEIKGLGSMADTAGIWCRGKNVMMDNNRIYSLNIDQGNSGIKLLGQSGYGFILKNNQLFNITYGVKGDEMPVDLLGLDMEGNKFIQCHDSTRLSSNKTKTVKAVIRSNQFISRSSCLRGNFEDTVIEGNYFEYAWNSSNGNAIQSGQNYLNGVLLNLVIKDNIIKKAGSGGKESYPIRIYNSENYVIINNIIAMKPYDAQEIQLEAMKGLSSSIIKDNLLDGQVTGELTKKVKDIIVLEKTAFDVLPEEKKKDHTLYLVKNDSIRYENEVILNDSKEKTILSDSFTRPDRDTLGTADTGQSWVNYHGGFGIKNNRAVARTLSPGPALLAVSTVNVNTTAYVITCRMTFQKSAGIVFRAVNPSSYLFCSLSITGGFRLYRYATEILQINDFKPVAGNLYEIRVMNNGDSIQCYVNNTLLIEAVSSLFPSGTNVGIRAYDDLETVIHSFKVEAL